MVAPNRDPVLIPYRFRGADRARAPWLLLYVGGQLVPHYALVDSGAEYSLIPRDIARHIGVEFDETKALKGGAAGGAIFRFFMGTNQLAVQTEVGGLTFDRPLVADSDHFILGRHDFFARYIVTFDEREQRMEIRPSPSVERLRN